MNQFNPSAVTFRDVMLKSVSTALGGGMVIEVDGKLTRQKIPFAVARDFQVRNFKVTSFVKSVKACVAYYSGHVVAIERMPLVTGLDESQVWVSQMESRFNEFKRCVTTAALDQMCFDGRFLYNQNNITLNPVSHGKWSTGEVGCYDLSLVFRPRGKDAQALAESRQEVMRNVVILDTPIGKVVTPPVWTGGALGLSSGEEKTFQFQDFTNVDNHLFVHVGFALAAARVVRELEGYEAIECLGLPEMMIALNTVNLGDISKDRKRLLPIGMKFTHCMSWLMGVMYRNRHNIQAVMQIRALLKQMSTAKGVVHHLDAITKIADIPSLEPVGARLKELRDAKAEFVQSSLIFNSTEAQKTAVAV